MSPERDSATEIATGEGQALAPSLWQQALSKVLPLIRR